MYDPNENLKENLDTDYSWTIHETRVGTENKKTIRYNTNNVSGPPGTSTLRFSVDTNAQRLIKILFNGNMPKIDQLNNPMNEKYFEALKYLGYSEKFGLQTNSVSLKDPDLLTALNIYLSTLCDHKIISPRMLKSIQDRVLETTSDQLLKFNIARLERIQQLYLEGNFSQALDLTMKYEKLTQDAFTDKLIEVCFDNGDLKHFITFCHFIVSYTKTSQKEASDYKELFFKLAEKFFTGLDSLNLDSITKREYLKLTLSVLDAALPNDYAARLKTNIFYILSGEKMDCESKKIFALTTLPADFLILVTDALCEKNTQLDNLKQINRSSSQFPSTTPMLHQLLSKAELGQRANLDTPKLGE